MTDRETDGANAGSDDTAVATSAPVAAPVSDAPAERSFEDVRADIADKILADEDPGDLTKELDVTGKGPARGPDGKFAPKEAAPSPDAQQASTPAVVDPALAQAKPVDQVAKAVEDKGHGRIPPAWLAPEAKDAWTKAPTPVVDAFMKRAREFETANSSLGRENKALADFQKDHAPFADVAERHRDV